MNIPVIFCLTAGAIAFLSGCYGAAVIAGGLTWILWDGKARD